MGYVREKFHELAADVQKFPDAWRLIRSSDPIGVSEDQVLSIPIAKNLGIRDGLLY